MLYSRSCDAVVIIIITFSASLDDPDYVEFSLAEGMVSRDPRLRALKKRLQAKRQLLGQLNKMYTSFLGGNVAACKFRSCLLYTSPSPRDATLSRMPSSA